MARAMRWPDGSDQVMCRSRFRCGREIGGSPDAIAASGSRNSGVEMCVSIFLFGRIAGVRLPGPSVKVGPKSKNVCQPITGRGLVCAC